MTCSPLDIEAEIKWKLEVMTETRSVPELKKLM